MANVFVGDVRIEGNLSVTGTSYQSAASITNASVASNAEIASTKVKHRRTGFYSDIIGTDVVTSGRVLYRCYASVGTILKAYCGSVVAAGAATTVTVDIKKNGTTVLSATIVLDNGNTAYVAEEGTLSVTSLVAGDVITATWTLSGANEPTGFFVGVDVEEAGV